MRSYRSLALFSFLLVVASGHALAQSSTKARTENGKDVVLYPDGTWKYASEEPATKRNSTYVRPPSAHASYKPDRGDFVIWYDETKWQLEKPRIDDDKGHLRPVHTDGYAMIIAEGLPIPMASLKKVALENATAAAPDARIVSEETRIVNGKEVIVLVIDGTIHEIPFRYYGYYFSGKQGTIQFLTFTGQNLFDRYKAEFTELLNGLEIKD